jgi:hypothetical protein
MDDGKDLLRRFRQTIVYLIPGRHVIEVQRDGLREILRPKGLPIRFSRRVADGQRSVGGQCATNLRERSSWVIEVVKDLGHPDKVHGATAQGKAFGEGLHGANTFPSGGDGEHGPGRIDGHDLAGEALAKAALKRPVPEPRSNTRRIGLVGRSAFNTEIHRSIDSLGRARAAS